MSLPKPTKVALFDLGGPGHGTAQHNGDLAQRIAFVDEWYKQCAREYPDLYPQRPKPMTLSRAQDTLRDLIEMGFSLESIKITLDWGIKNEFWGPKIGYLHLLNQPLQSEPITLYESIRRARQQALAKDAARGARTLPPIEDYPAAVRAFLREMQRTHGETAEHTSLPSRAAMLDDIYRIWFDYYARVGFDAKYSNGFKTMFPTFGAYMVEFLATLNQDFNRWRVIPWYFIPFSNKIAVRFSSGMGHDSQNREAFEKYLQKGGNESAAR